MKFQILTVSFFLSLLLLLLLASSSEAFFHCKRLVKQYHECKHLNMTPVDNQTFLSLGVRYQPNPAIKVGNQLGDEFYREHLGNLTLAQAFDLFWSIYDEAGRSNCSSASVEFCKCASFSDIDTMGKYAKWFRTRDVFGQVKRTIVDMYEKNPNVPLDLSDMTPLDAFCEKYDMFPFSSLITSQKIISCADLDETRLVRPFHFNSFSNSFKLS